MNIVKIDRFVSVIVVIRNVEGQVSGYLEKLGKYLSLNFTDYEIVLVDRKSLDRTASEVQKMLGKVRSVRFLELAFGVDEDVAHAAGMESAIGDFVVLFSPERDPLDCIRLAVEKSLKGFDVVVGISVQRQTLPYAVVRPAIQHLLRVIGYEIPRNATSFRCLTRSALNTVTHTGRFHHQLYVRISKSGHPVATLEYKSINLETRTLISGFKQTLDLLVFNSTAPLRWMSITGAVGSFFAFCFAAYSMLIRLFKDDVIEGWTSLAFVMSFLFMLLFMILAFFGEYLGRLLDDRSEHRDYSISKESNSSVMADSDRLNVLIE